MRSFLKGEEIVLRSPNAVRPWTFVLDVLHAYLLVAVGLQRDTQTFMGSWNVASGCERTVQDLVKECLQIVQKGSIRIDPASSIGAETHFLGFILRRSCKRTLILATHAI